jgi:hypothetical protein
MNLARGELIDVAAAHAKDIMPESYGDRRR